MSRPGLGLPAGDIWRACNLTLGEEAPCGDAAAGTPLPQDALRRRAYAARILSEDAMEGGRFKRFGCIPLPPSDPSSTTIHAINSAILKLSKLQPVDRVYRGLSGGILQAERASKRPCADAERSDGSLRRAALGQSQAVL